MSTDAKPMAPSSNGLGAYRSDTWTVMSGPSDILAVCFGRSTAELVRDWANQIPGTNYSIVPGHCTAVIDGIQGRVDIHIEQPDAPACEIKS